MARLKTLTDPDVNAAAEVWLPRANPDMERYPENSGRVGAVVHGLSAALAAGVVWWLWRESDRADRALEAAPAAPRTPPPADASTANATNASGYAFATQNIGWRDQNAIRALNLMGSRGDWDCPYIASRPTIESKRSIARAQLRSYFDRYDKRVNDVLQGREVSLLALSDPTELGRLLGNPQALRMVFDRMVEIMVAQCGGAPRGIVAAAPGPAPAQSNVSLSRLLASKGK
jgi:hypothetical protein